MKNLRTRILSSLEDLSPEQAALMLAIGLVLGVFPIVGCPTLLCTLAAIALRLNLPAIHVVNQISSPMQYALLLPLARLGAWICGADSTPTASVPAQLGAAALHAVAGWLCVCLPLSLALYFALLPLLRRCRPGWSNSLESPA